MLKVKIKKGYIKRVALIKKAKIFNNNFQTTFSCSLKHKHLNKDIEYAKEQIDFKSKSKKKKIGSLILLIVNFLIIGGIFTYYFATNEIKDLSEIFHNNVKLQFLFLAVIMLLVTIIIETIRFVQLIYKTTGKIRIGLSLKTYLLGKYYDNITPFNFGGQPFQIFYLNKHGIKGDNATSIPLVKHVINTSAFLLLSVLVLILNFIFKFTNSIVIIIIAIMAIILNGSLVALVLLFSVSKRIGPSLVIKILKLLNRLKIIKNYKVTFFKVSRFVKNYQKSVKLVAKSVKTLICQFVLAILNFITFYSIVYFIYLAFIPENTFGIVEILSCMALCDICGGVMPLPGGSGAAEISFDALFSRLFITNPGALPYAMLIWRFLTYFIFIIIGGIQIFCSFIKNKWLARKNKPISK